MNPVKRFFIIVVIATILPLTTVFTVNYLYDPLWYNDGNQIEDDNYAFNERLAKTNQFLNTYEERQYNCLIFGSSRTTLLNETLLEAPYNCFNYSFSAGRTKELTAFAKWLKNKNISPKYIIIGIDDFNFYHQDRPLNIPDFIQKQSSPPNIYQSYLSFDALKMTLKMFIHYSPLPRMYDKNFVCKIREDAPEYKPILGKGEKKRIPDLDIIKEYRNIVELFPEAYHIGYVPPISSWRTHEKSQQELDYLLDSLYKLSYYFEEFYDFSIPGDITSQPKNTFDGAHFYPRINNLVAESINDKKLVFGISLKAHNREQYVQAYQDALDDFIKKFSP